MLSPRSQHRRAVPALHGGRRQGASPSDQLQHDGGGGHGRPHEDGAGGGDAALRHGVPPDQPSARLPGLRPGGRVLATDLLHAPRPLRSADGRREGAQAQGHPAGAACHPRRGALHPVLALRSVLRRGHGHWRARHLSPRRSLRDRPLPRQDPREQVCEQCDRHLPGGRAHRPRLPVPGARLVPRFGQVGVQWLRPRVQCRDPHEPSAPASQPGQAGGPDQAPRERPGQQVVDLRRGPLRVRLDRR